MTIHGVTGDINRDGVLDEKRSKGRNWRQLAAVKRVLEYWRTHGHHKPHPMLALPTGFGKGVIIQRILRQMPHKKILLIVGAKNLLLDQSKQVLIDYAKQESGSTDYSVFPDTSGKVVLATWQGLASAYRRSKGLDIKFGLAIVDEVHNSGTWRRLDILRELAPDAIVGLTATAYRSSGAYKWPNEYGFEIVDAMPLPECIMKGWLSPMAGIAIDTHVLLPKEVKEMNKLNYRRINKALGNHPHLFERIATEVGTRFLPSGMKTVIIVNRIEQEACVIARILKQMGYSVGLAVNQGKSRALSGEFVTTDAIFRYKLPPEHPDSIQVLISPQVIGEGFDAPMTECVVWAAPTMSAVRYTQVVGRGTRICPGKKFCLIVDFVYMIENYGYSYNFAQFMPTEVLQELPNGIMYIGPDYVLPTVQVPPDFTRGGDLVSVFDLVTPFYPPAEDWMTAAHMAKCLGRSEPWIAVRLLRFADIAQQRVFRRGVALHYPPYVLEDLRKENEEFPWQKEGWRSCYQLSQEIGKSQNWIATRLKPFRKKAEKQLDRIGRPVEVYPPEVVEAVKAAVPTVPYQEDWRTAKEMSDSLGFSLGWAQVALQEIGAKSELRQNSGGQVFEYYPPETQEALEKYRRQAPDAGDWLTVSQLVKEVGSSKAIVKLRLKQLEIKSENRRSLSKGYVKPHYPPSAVKALKEVLEKYPLSGDWLTVNQVVNALGSDESTVRRMILVSFSGEGQKRLGSSGYTAEHYPPSIVDRMRALLRRVPRAGKWLTLADLRRMVPRSDKWIRDRLKEWGITGEERRVGDGSYVLTHYPPNTVERLLKAGSVPPADGWLTASAIARKVGTYPRNAAKLLAKYGYVSKIRLDKGGHEKPHYDPSVVEELRKIIS